MNTHMELIELIDGYFSSRKWKLKRCPQCSAGYFTKVHRDFDSCNSYGCSGYKFSNIPSPRKFVDLSDGAKMALGYFTGREYDVAQPICVARSEERTLFASAAGQIFDNLIYGSVLPNIQSRYFVIQPVIRLQGLDKVGKLEGISTSFLHVATEHWNASATDYLEALDNWLSFFSFVGLYVGDLALKISTGINDWAGKKVVANSIKMNYYGLEIGIANFFMDIPSSQGRATMSDVGVGMERLLWAVNKSPSYFDAMAPLTFINGGDTILLDSVRTMALMAGSGVTPSHKNHGFKFRSIASKIAEPLYKFPLAELTDFYYEQWLKFVGLNQSLGFVRDVIRREVDRNANLNLNRALERDDPYNVSHETFLRSLAKKIGIRNLMTAIESGGYNGE